MVARQVVIHLEPATVQVLLLSLFIFAAVLACWVGNLMWQVCRIVGDVFCGIIYLAALPVWAIVRIVVWVALWNRPKARSVAGNRCGR